MDVVDVVDAVGPPGNMLVVRLLLGGQLALLMLP